MSNDFESLLPPSISIDERFVLLEQLSARLNHLDLTPVLTDLVDIVAVDVLPWLAEQFSLFGDGWELTTSVDAQRALIKKSIEIHRHKGTPWAIKETLKLLGYGDAELIEGGNYHHFDGEFAHDSEILYADLHWWQYGLKMASALFNADAARIRVMLGNIAPARCELALIDFRANAFYYNSVLSHDGHANYGVA